MSEQGFTIKGSVISIDTGYGFGIFAPQLVNYSWNIIDLMVLKHGKPMLRFFSANAIKP